MSNPNDEGRPFQPAPPVPDGEGAAPLVRPKAIDTAFQASITATALGALGTLVTFLFDQAVLESMARDTLARAGQSTTDADVASLTGLMRVALILGVAIFVGLFVLFSFKMRGGRNWARMVLTVFAAIGAVNFLSAMASTGAALELMWNLAETAFAVTAVVYMFRKESTAYFQSYKQRRLRR